MKRGETTNDLCAFLTTEPNKEVGAIHPKAMPVIFTRPEEWDTWLHGNESEDVTLQPPLREGLHTAVARGNEEN